MNILLINHYAGSPDMGMEFRPYYMAREWVKSGHEVSIIAGDFSHLRRKNPSVSEDFTKEVIDGIDYFWVKSGIYEGNGVKRAVTMARFVGKLWIKAKWIAQEFKPDVVIASSTYPLDTYAAQRIRKYSGAKYIHEIHDMWPISPMELGGMSKYHPFIVVMQIAENSFCRNADKIISLLPNACEYLTQHGMRKEKFYCVPNGVILEEWNDSRELPTEHEEVFARLRKERKFIVGFFGSHTKSYALTYLIDALRKLNNERVCAVFVGGGIEKENLIRYASDLGMQTYFLPSVDKACIPNLLRKMDCIYIGAVNNRMFRFGICMNKLFDAMMSGTPILYAVNAPNNYIEDFHCGISVAPENAEALQIGIKKILEMSEEERERMGQNGKRAVLEHFQYGILAEKFIEIAK